MKATKFCGFTPKAIFQWGEILETGEVDPTKHTAAMNEGLALVINGEILLAPNGDTENPVTPGEWVRAYDALKALGTSTSTPAESEVVREFGDVVITAASINENSTEAEPVQKTCVEFVVEVQAVEAPNTTLVEVLEVPPEDDLPWEEPVAVVEEPCVAEPTELMPEPEEIPEEPELASPEEEIVAAVEEEVVAVEEVPMELAPEEIEVVEPVEAELPAAPAAEAKPESAPAPTMNDALRAKVGAIPTYYSPLKEPLNKLIDLGADDLVITTALDLAGKPYNLGVIADYARHILVNATPGRDFMLMVQAAHSAASKVENTTEANSAIMEEILSVTPVGNRRGVRMKLEAHIDEGSDKYWAEAWGQAVAAKVAGRSTSPVNLFMSIVRDFQHNATLADKRAEKRITDFSEIRWIMEYLPKTPVEYPDEAIQRGNRKNYLPRLKTDVERMGYIPLRWVLAILVDNDYPVNLLGGITTRMGEKYPVLKEITTRDQFDWAVEYLTKVMLERAMAVRETWDDDCYENRLYDSMAHHALYAGKAYLGAFKEHAEVGTPFMEPFKELLNTVLADEDSMKLMDDWHMDTFAWKHGKTPEAALEHRQDQRDYQIRAKARQEELRRSAGTGTDNPE